MVELGSLSVERTTRVGSVILKKDSWGWWVYNLENGEVQIVAIQGDVNNAGLAIIKQEDVISSKYLFHKGLKQLKNPTQIFTKIQTLKFEHELFKFERKALTEFEERMDLSRCVSLMQYLLVGQVAILKDNPHIISSPFESRLDGYILYDRFTWDVCVLLHLPKEENILYFDLEHMDSFMTNPDKFVVTQLNENFMKVNANQYSKLSSFRYQRISSDIEESDFREFKTV